MKGLEGSLLLEKTGRSGGRGVQQFNTFPCSPRALPHMLNMKNITEFPSGPGGTKKESPAGIHEALLDKGGVSWVCGDLAGA